MPKYLAKLSKFGGQHRITLPKLLIKEAEWQDVEFVIIDRLGVGGLRIRRFVDAEELGIKGKRDRPGSDR